MLLHKEEWLMKTWMMCTHHPLPEHVFLFSPEKQILHVTAVLFQQQQHLYTEIMLNCSWFDAAYKMKQCILLMIQKEKKLWNEIIWSIKQGEEWLMFSQSALQKK